MNAKRIEQQSLNRGVIINILMGSAGMLVYAFTHLEALFLDASFVLIECHFRHSCRRYFQNKSEKNETVSKGAVYLRTGLCVF
ncbi:MAG: hypothetical protein ABF547_12355 [Lentilactobacillus hilgardii]|uniref:hypothetical protein n=1 Tax=Lentilactobacillus hilgardii TaxID=1588 RepID=UPI0039E89093